MAVKTKPRLAMVKARKEKGMTQQELADIVGINRAFLSNIERGKYAPSLKVARDIAHVLEEEMESLFFDSNVRKTRTA